MKKNEYVDCLNVYYINETIKSVVVNRQNELRFYNSTLRSRGRERILLPPIYFKR